MLYESRRSADALAAAVRHYRGGDKTYAVEPRADGRGYEVVQYVPAAAVGRVVEPTQPEHDLAMWYMVQLRET